MVYERTRSNCRGFTLVEISVAMVSAAVLTLAVTLLLADHQRGYNRVYDSAFCPAAEACSAARIVFRKTMRQASAQGGATIAPDGRWIEVRYYSNPGVSPLDCTARFYQSDQDLLLLKTVTATGQALSLETVCHHVTSVHFDRKGAATRMSLQTEDGSSSRTLNTSAVMRSP